MPPKVRQKKPLERDALGAYALRLLGQRDYASAELEKRLTAKAADPTDVPWVLNWLSQRRFLNDAAMAERSAEHGLQVRKLGKRRVAMELEQRAVDARVAAETVERIYREVDERTLAREHLESKLRSFLAEGVLEDRKQLQRAYGRLRRAGFSHYATVCALREHSRLAGSMDEMSGGED